jgi:hypothetical protein
MAKTIPFPQRAQARSRRTKTMLLPMPCTAANDLALQVHLALSALRLGGSLDDARALLHAHVLAQSIADAGYGTFEAAQIQAADAALLQCFERGNTGGGWQLDPSEFEALAHVITVYDAQLQSAPMWVLAEASDRLERMSAGEFGQSRMRRHA